MRTDSVPQTQRDRIPHDRIAGAQAEPVDSGYCVTNGSAFSPDGRTMHHTDSVLRPVFAFDVSAAGELSNRCRFVVLDGDEGYPDGRCTDADAHPCAAHRGGARVTQRGGAGRVLRRVRVPAPNLTKVAFGGPALRDLCIISARMRMPKAALAGIGYAGGVFVWRGAGQGQLPAAG